MSNAMINEKDIRNANKAGLRHNNNNSDCWSYYSPLLQAAYDLGRYHGLAVGGLVTGWRYGDVPEFGVSKNYVTGDSEGGLSMAKIDGVESSWRGFLMTARKKVNVSGLLSPLKGSDNEPLIFPVDLIENLDLSD
jgi:hypothetical protein